MSAREEYGSVVQRIAQYIADNFQLRRCKRYVKVYLEGSTTAKERRLFHSSDCCCGRSVEWHIKNGAKMPPALRNAAIDGPQDNTLVDCDSNKDRWSVGEDTLPHQCDTFGELFFVPGEESACSVIPGSCANYVRLPNDADLEKVYHLMTSKQLWSLPVPQLIIEVASTKPKKNVHVNKELLSRFNEGIIKAAKVTNAWLVTGGRHQGIMSIIGDAVARSRMMPSNSSGITCLGIVPFGVVNHRDQLVNFDQHEKREPNDGHVAIDLAAASAGLVVTKETLAENWTTCYSLEKSDGLEDELTLDPGHTCFILVDSGREKRFGEEQDFRNRFLHFISKKALNDGISGAGSMTPVVLLVVGGSLKTLEAVEQTITFKFNGDCDQPSSSVQQGLAFPRPVVLLSGLYWGASDLLSFAYNITNGADASENQSKPKDDESQFPVDFEERIRNHVAFDNLLSGLPESRRTDVGNRLVALIKRCLKFRSMISVVNLLDSTTISLNNALLDAFFKSNFGSPASTFELAQLWDRIDVAKNLLTRYNAEIRQNVDTLRALSRAILNGQADFVKLFTSEAHADLNSYLTLSRMKTFYIELFINRFGRAGKSSCIRLFRSLMMRESMNMTERLAQRSPVSFLQSIGRILSRLLGCYMDNVFTDEKPFKKFLAHATLMTPEALQLFFNKPYPTSLRDIFLLQLLVRRNELSNFFFRVGHDHVGTAVMATIFLQSLSKEAERLDMTDLAYAYQDTSGEWQQRAINLLSSCYEYDPMVCGQLLKRSLATWQSLTVLEMAYYGNRKEVMEQPAVQTILSQAWLGRMASFSRPRLIYMALLMPFLIFRIRFEERTTHNHAVAQQSSEASVKVADLTTQRRKSIGQWAHRMLPISAAHRDVHLANASLFHAGEQGKISVLRAFYILYSSPMAKYATHSFVLACFLVLFSFFVLDGIHKDHIHAFEIVTWFCCAVYFLDHLRQTFGQTHLSFSEKVQDFLFNVWVMADVIGFTIVVTAVILRFIVSDDAMAYPHTIYAIACVLYWLKSLRIFFVSEVIGTKVFTLFKMMKDVVFFVLIYLILLLSFSTPIHALLYPDQEIDSPRVFFSLLLDITYERMWNIFVVSMDNSRTAVEGTCQFAVSSNPGNSSASSQLQTSSRYDGCSQRNIVAIVLYIIFLILTNISLLNMLIAMFAHTVDKTRASATRMWRFNIYRFLQEYYFRPVLPGPLMIFELVYRFVQLLYSKTAKSTLFENTDLKENYYSGLQDYDYRKLEMFEHSLLDAAFSHETVRDKAAEKHDRILSKLQNILTKMQRNDGTGAKSDKIPQDNI